MREHDFSDAVVREIGQSAMLICQNPTCLCFTGYASVEGRPRRIAEVRTFFRPDRRGRVPLPHRRTARLTRLAVQTVCGSARTATQRLTVIQRAFLPLNCLSGRRSIKTLSRGSWVGISRRRSSIFATTSGTTRKFATCFHSSIVGAFCMRGWMQSFRRASSNLSTSFVRVSCKREPR